MDRPTFGLPFKKRRCKVPNWFNNNRICQFSESNIRNTDWPNDGRTNYTSSNRNKLKIFFCISLGFWTNIMNI